MVKRNLTLKNKFLFKYIFNKGTFISSQYLSVLFVKNFPSYVEVGSLQPKLFGVTVSSKFSTKSVVRNRIRRLIFANVSTHYDLFKPGYYIFVPKKNLIGRDGKINVNVEEFNADFNKVLSKMVVL
jgi:ribonuclease P protein component